MAFELVQVVRDELLIMPAPNLWREPGAEKVTHIQRPVAAGIGLPVDEPGCAATLRVERITEMRVAVDQASRAFVESSDQSGQVMAGCVQVSAAAPAEIRLWASPSFVGNCWAGKAPDSRNPEPRCRFAWRVRPRANRSWWLCQKRPCTAASTSRSDRICSTDAASDARPKCTFLASRSSMRMMAWWSSRSAK